MTVKVTVFVKSSGDEWAEVVQEIKAYLKTKGFQNVAEGSGDALASGGKKWQAVSLERKIE